MIIFCVVGGKKDYHLRNALNFLYIFKRRVYIFQRDCSQIKILVSIDFLMSDSLYSPTSGHVILLWKMVDGRWLVQSSVSLANLIVRIFPLFSLKLWINNLLERPPSHGRHSLQRSWFHRWSDRKKKKTKNSFYKSK